MKQLSYCEAMNMVTVRDFDVAARKLCVMENSANENYAYKGLLIYNC